jgi:hypothetical protein
MTSLLNSMQICRLVLKLLAGGGHMDTDRRTDREHGSLQATHSFLRKERNKMRPYIQSFTGAYSPGRTFGLPFRGLLITHIQTHGRTPLDEWGPNILDQIYPLCSYYTLH